MRRRQGLLALARRGSWNLADQILSAVTNVVVAFVVARATGARAFGAFAVAFLIFTMSVGVARALAGQPLSIRFSAAEPAAFSTAASAAMGAVLVFATGVAVVSAAIGAVAGGVVGSTLVAIAVVLPVLLLQDACRMAFFAQRRAHLATLNDAVWAAVQFPIMLVLVLIDVDRPWAFVLAWGGGALFAALLGMKQIGMTPLVAKARSWMRDERDLVGYLAAEYLLNSGVYQGGVLAVGVLIGFDNVGSLRAAQVLLGPLGIISAAGGTFLLPELSRRQQRAAVRMKLAVAISVAMGGISVAYGGLLLLLPDSIGTELLGDTWSGARSVLLPMAVGSAALGVTMGPQLTVFSLGRAKALFTLQIIQAPLILVCIFVGVVVDDAAGAAWGIAANSLIMVPLCFVLLRWVLTHEPKAASVVPVEGLAPLSPAGLGDVVP